MDAGRVEGRAGDETEEKTLSGAGDMILKRVMVVHRRSPAVRVLTRGYIT